MEFRRLVADLDFVHVQPPAPVVAVVAREQRDGLFADMALDEFEHRRQDEALEVAARPCGVSFPDLPAGRWRER